MSKRLVELMGGVIGVESTIGVGSVFWFELISSYEPQLAGGDVKPTVVSSAQIRDGSPQRTLLYIEDNLANLKLVEQIIARRPDVRMLSALNAEIGLQLARDHRPDVILMDPQFTWHQRQPSAENPERRSDHGAHPGACTERQCHAGRYQKRPGSWIFPLPHQTD